MDDKSENSPDDSSYKMNISLQKTDVDPLQSDDYYVNCESISSTSDSDEYLSENLRYSNFRYSTRSKFTDKQNSIKNNDNISYTSDINSIQIPIVGYEILEERARYTAYKLRVENRETNVNWYVFRRYTDFVNLCKHLKDYPEITRYLPNKRYLKNNFERTFLEERVNSLQTLVNAILNEPKLMEIQEIQDFFCLNEAPNVWQMTGESKAVFEALEDSIGDLNKQLKEKESKVYNLYEELNSKMIENENLKKLLRKSSNLCEKCQKEIQK